MTATFDAVPVTSNAVLTTSNAVLTTSNAVPFRRICNPPVVRSGFAIRSLRSKQMVRDCNRRQTESHQAGLNGRGAKEEDEVKSLYSKRTDYKSVRTVNGFNLKAMVPKQLSEADDPKRKPRSRRHFYSGIKGSEVVSRTENR